MKYSEDLINDVREYLQQGEIEETADCLIETGHDWCKLYDLDDLYNEYCWGNLPDVINLFVCGRIEASDYGEYFVKYGDLYESCDFEDAIWEVLDDDEVIEKIVDYILDGRIVVSDDLSEIINSRNVTWDDVDDALHTHFHNSLVSEREAFNDPLYGNSPNEFAEVCRRIEDMRSAFNCLLKTKFSNIPEERYADIVSVLDANPNWLMGVGMVARGYMKDGIPFAKGVEMYLKVGSSWFGDVV